LVVDVGAGAGLFGEYLRSKMPLARYHFVEPLGSLERSLESRFGAERNARGAPDFGRFDAVVLLDVLEHQADDGAFLRDLVGKMRPGARLVLTVPALPALWSPWDAALGHHRRYTKESLRALVHALPVEEREVSYLFPEMIPAAVYRKLKLGGRALARAEESHFPRLPRMVNQGLYALAKLSFLARRAAPAGTSLLAALDVAPSSCLSGGSSL
jgi:SAM-dependent methyltransferase